MLANDHQSNREITNDEKDSHRNELLRKLLREANYFALASHFFVALWAIHLARTSTIEFGFLVRENICNGIREYIGEFLQEYARARLTAYYLQRHLLTTASKEMPPEFTEELLRSTKNPFQKHFMH